MMAKARSHRVSVYPLPEARLDAAYWRMGLRATCYMMEMVHYNPCSGNARLKYGMMHL